MTEKTLSILKPDAVQRNIVGKINSYIESAGLKIIASKMIWLNKKQAEGFYAVHKKAPFFAELVNFMTSGPVILQVLSGGNDAILNYRSVMGNTDPTKAENGTIRADFAKSIDANCVHGSDSAENAEKEINFFFAKYEIFE